MYQAKHAGGGYRMAVRQTRFRSRIRLPMPAPATMVPRNLFSSAPACAARFRARCPAGPVYAGCPAQPLRVPFVY